MPRAGRHRGAAGRRRGAGRICSWSSTAVPRRPFTAGTFGPGPLKWIYLTLGLLMAATMVDMYVPLFGQRLADLVPGPPASSARCWRSGGPCRELASASVSRTRAIVRVVAAAPRCHGGRAALGAVLSRDKCAGH